MAGCLATGWGSPQGRGPRQLPGNGEGGEPSVPCLSGPARRRHWRTWRLREAPAVAKAAVAEAAAATAGTARRWVRPGTPHDGSPPLPGRGAAREPLCPVERGAVRNAQARGGVCAGAIRRCDLIFRSQLRHPGSKTQRVRTGRSRLMQSTLYLPRWATKSCQLEAPSCGPS